MLPNDFSVTITKLTDIELLRKLNSYTTGKPSQQSAASAYRAMHSPVRAILFLVEMRNVPTAVSTHFTRHKTGVEHFVKSNRPDRGGDGKADRDTPLNHAMLLNAQALQNILAKRLCKKSMGATVKVAQAIKNALIGVDNELWQHLHAQCVLCGVCGEPKSCGYINSMPGLAERVDYVKLFK